MSNSPNFNSNDKLENIIKSLTEQLLTKEDLKGIHYKLNRIIETVLPTVLGREVRGGMSPFGSPTPDTRFFQPPTNPGVSPFNQRGNQMPGFFKSGDSFNGAFRNLQTNDDSSQTEAMKHPSDDIIRTPTGQVIVVKKPLLQPDEQYIRYELDLTQPKLRVTHHVSTPNGSITLYHTTIDGKKISREVLPRMSQQPTMSNSDKSNPLSGAFPGPQLTPDQVKINVLEKRIEALEKLLFEGIIPRLETLEKQSTKKVNVSEPKIEGGVDLYRDLTERLNTHRAKGNDAETVGKGEVKVTGVYGPFTSYNQPKMYLENKEEIDKIHEKLKDVENIDDLRSLDLMYLVLSCFYSAGDDGRASNKLLLKIRCGVTDIIQFLEERGLNSTYPETFNHISGRK